MSLFLSNVRVAEIPRRGSEDLDKSRKKKGVKRGRKERLGGGDEEGQGDKIRTFHKEAAVAPPQQKPHPRATTKC